MSSDLSSDNSSSNSELAKTRANLLQEQQQLKKEIRTARAKAQRFQNDLQMAQDAYNIGEMAFLKRTKKIADLFGGQLKSDEDLIQKVQELMKEADENEQKAKELRAQLEEQQLAKIKNDSMMADAQNELQKQQDFYEKKKGELQKAENLYEMATNEYNKAKKKKDDLVASLLPIAQVLGVSEINEDFFNKLQQAMEQMNPSYEDSLRNLANVAGIPFNGMNGNDISSFLDNIMKVYCSLQKQTNEQKKLENEVISKLDKLKNQVENKEMEAKQLQETINRLTNDIEHNKKKKLDAYSLKKSSQQNRLNEIRAKEMNHIKRVLEKMGVSQLLTPETTLDEAVEIQCNIILKMARKVVEIKQGAMNIDYESRNRLQKNIGAIGEVADCIISSNRVLLRKLK